MRNVMLVALLAFAGVARAETKIEVSSETTLTEVPLGDDIEVKVSVKNAGTADVELPELTFDARSVSFEITFEDGKPAWDTRFNIDPPRSAMEPDPLKPIARKTLKAGETWTKPFTIPAIASGTWAIIPVYCGTTDPEPKSLSAAGKEGRLVRIKGESKGVKVLPGPNLESEVWAKLTTTMGTIAFKFFPKDALGSALNFVRIVKQGYYDGKSFHRIDSSLTIIQGGAANADGSGNFDWTIPRELRLQHKQWNVGMARSSDPNSAGAQFYINYGPLAKTLDRPDGYAVFAEVVKGKDVVETLSSVKTRGGPGMAGQAPMTPIQIESSKIQLAAKE
jgi:peptidyl-prolyl cis-trans isomerase B (cyclophilin B)